MSYRISVFSYPIYMDDLSALVDRESKAIEKHKKITREALQNKANQCCKRLPFPTRPTFTRAIGYKRK